MIEFIIYDNWQGWYLTKAANDFLLESPESIPDASLSKLKAIKRLIIGAIIMDWLGLSSYGVFFVKSEIFWYGGLTMIKAISGMNISLIV